MMKLLCVAALAAAATSPAAAQDAHAAHAGHAVAAPAATATTTARLSLDTPIQGIMADAAGKAVLDKHMPGMDKHPQWEMAKGLSLRQVAGYAPQHFTPELLAKIEADLALVK